MSLILFFDSMKGVKQQNAQQRGSQRSQEAAAINQHCCILTFTKSMIGGGDNKLLDICVIYSEYNAP